MTASTMTARFGSGREVKRIEDEGLLQGAGRFADDFAPAGHVHVRFLRSPHAHARIAAIDPSAALAAPGVLAVYTGAELAAAGVKPIPLAPMFQRPDGSPGASPLRPALAVEVARYVGEPVAAVVAETADAAKDALDLIEVDYEPLPAVAGVAAATAPGRAATVARRIRQHRRADAPWRCGQDRRRLRQRGACGIARSRQSAPRRRADGAARLRWPSLETAG